MAELLAKPASGLTETLFHGARERKYRRQECIVEAGAPADGIFLVESGLIGLEIDCPSGAKLCAILPAGTVVGSRVYRSSPGTYAVRALAKVVAREIPEKEACVALMSRDVYDWSALHHQRLITNMASMASAAGQRTADRKILAFVECFIAASRGGPVGDSACCDWLVRQSQLAEVLGITRTHLNARLSALEKSGTLVVSGRKIFWRRGLETHA